MKTIAILLALTASACLPAFATINWTNATGGDWNVAQNWNPNQIPGASDTVSISGGINVSVSATNSSGPLTVSGGASLTVATNGVFTFLGTLTLQGPLTNQGTINWQGGNVSVSFGSGNTGEIWNQSGAVWDAQCDQSINFAFTGTETFHNAGTLRKSAGAGVTTVGLYIDNSGTINGQTGFINLTYAGNWSGTFQGQVGVSNAVPAVTGSYAGTLAFYANSGIAAGSTLTVGNGGTMNILGNISIRGALTNAGTVHWQEGSISVSLGGGSTGQIWNQTGGLWDVQCDQSITLAYSGTEAFHNFGTLRKSVGSGVTTFGLFLDNAGTVNGQTGLINLTSSARLDGNLQGQVGISNATPVVTGTYAGVLNLFSGGGIAAGSTLGVSNASTLNIFGNVSIRGQLTNWGTVNWQAGTVSVTFGGGSTGEIWNQSGALWDIQCDQPISYAYSGTEKFHNSGTLRKSSGTGTAKLDVYLDNFGLVQAQTGMINCSFGGNLSGTFQGEVGISNATPATTGTFTGSFNFYGGAGIGSGSGLTVGAGGVLNIVGNCTLSGVLTNLGTVNWINGSIQLNNSSVLNSDQIWNEPGALWDVQCDQSITPSSYPAQFDNRGTFRKSAGTNTSTIGVALVDSGAVRAQTGSLRFSAGGAFSGNVQADAGAAIFLGGGTFTNLTPTFQGPGSVGISNASPTMLGVISGNFGLYEGGGMGGGSALTLAEGGTINILGNVIIYGVLTNQGTVNWVNGSVQLYNTVSSFGMSQIWNLPGGLWDVACDQAMTAGFYPAQFENQGTFRKSAGAGTSTVGVLLDNTGTVRAQTGAIRLTGGGTLAGTIQADAGAAAFLGGGTFTNFTPTFQGAGEVGITNGTPTMIGTIAGTLGLYEGGGIGGGSALTVAGTGVVNILGNVTIYGALTNLGTIHWFNGAVQLYNTVTSFLTNQVWNQPGALFDIQCDQTLSIGFYPSQLVNLGTLRKSGGSGTSTISVALNSSGAVQGQSGIIRLTGGGTLAGTLQADAGAAVFLGGGTFTNFTPTGQGSGAVGITNGTPTMLGTIGGTFGFYGGGGMGTGSALTVASGGVLNILGNCSIYGALTNQGTVNWSGGTVQLFNTVTSFLTNQIWNLPGALWNVQCDQPMTVGYYPSQFENRGEFRKSGATATTSIAVAFTNSGTIAAQLGLLDFTLPCGLSSAANLRVTLGGVSPGTGFGRIKFDLPTPMAGIFTLGTTNGYRPNPGDNFSVINYPSASGDFLSMEGLDLGNGLRLDPHFNKSGLTLTAVAYATNANPSLVMAHSNRGLFVSWPPDFSGWQLTTATNLGNSGWVPVTVAGVNNTILATPLPEQYFRLQKN